MPRSRRKKVLVAPPPPPPGLMFWGKGFIEPEKAQAMAMKAMRYDDEKFLKQLAARGSDLAKA